MVSNIQLFGLGIHYYFVGERMGTSQIAFGQAVADSKRAIAPVWHTVIVLAVLLGFSLAGALAGNITAHGRRPIYILVMIVEWAIVAFIGYGISRQGMGMADLIGGRWEWFLDLLRDLGLGIGLIVLGSAVLNGVGYLLKAVPSQALRSALPQSGMEILLWIMMSLTAGFCEEVIFRGYLQRQFAALTRAAAGGIVLQGVVFGAAHGYQGWKFMLMIAVYGTMFGLLAHWRRSLRPGMFAHFLQDGIGGLLARHFMR